jgi:hypothetical protein
MKGKIGEGVGVKDKARLVSDWGHQGLCLRVLGAHFGHIFAHILHAGWRTGLTTGSIFEILTS